MGAVFEHLAQSIDMSLDGFPEPKSALFQNTVGAAAFAVFKWRGKLNHGLTDPIPGAPALAQAEDSFAIPAPLTRTSQRPYFFQPGKTRPQSIRVDLHPSAVARRPSPCRKADSTSCGRQL